MMYETGLAFSLKDMIEKFIVFAQKSNSNTMSWRLEDDRLSSFYGATLRIPNTSAGATKYAIPTKPKIVVIGDSVTAGAPYTNGTASGDEEDTDLFSWTSYVRDTLQTQVINMGIGGDELINENARYDSDVLSKKPDIAFICGGGNNSWDAGGITNLSTCETAFRDMISRTLKLGIAPIVGIYTAHNKYHLDKMRATSHTWWTDSDEANILNNFKLVRDMQIKVCNELGIKYIDLMKAVEDSSGNVKDEYFDFNASSKPNPTTLQYDYVHPNYEGYVAIGKSVVPVLKKLISENELNTYFYVSFQHTRVTGDTYSSWLRGSHNDFLSEQFDKTIDDGDYTYVNLTKYGGGNAENVFKDTGEFVAVGMHTMFDRNLWMCEQPQVTCTYESTHQPNEINLLQVRRAKYPKKGGTPSESKVSLPVFPGTGCPWFTLSDDNYSTFGVSKYGVRYFFTKQNSSATISYTTIGGNSTDTNAWQSMSFGRLNTINNNDEYKFPLYVAGGNVGIEDDIWNFFPVNPGSHRQHLEGNVYKLDIKNICLSNSNLLHPTNFYGANISNFRVMMPDGEWTNVYAHSQGATPKIYHYCNLEPDPMYGIHLEEPSRGYGSSQNSATLQISDCSHMVDSYFVNETFNQYKTSTPLEKIAIVLNPSKSNGATGIIGYLPNCYGSWVRSLFEGTFELDGKKYVSIPNGWYNRLYFYDWYLGVYNDEEYWENTSIRKKNDRNTNVMWERMFMDRLLIPIED